MVLVLNCYVLYVLWYATVRYSSHGKLSDSTMMTIQLVQTCCQVISTGRLFFFFHLLCVVICSERFLKQNAVITSRSYSFIFT